MLHPNFRLISLPAALLLLGITHVAHSQTITTLIGATYPVGTNYDGFIAQSNNPLAPFSNQAVLFRGYQQGGSNVTLGSAHLVYRFQIDYATSVSIDSVTVGGAGDQRLDAQIRLLDSNSNLIAAQPTSGFNTYGLTTLNANSVQGQRFFLEEYDDSTNYRFRNLIQINLAAVPEPGSIALLIGMSFMGVGLLVRKRRAAR